MTPVGAELWFKVRLVAATDCWRTKKGLELTDTPPSTKRKQPQPATANKQQTARAQKKEAKKQREKDHDAQNTGARR